MFAGKISPYYSIGDEPIQNTNLYSFNTLRSSCVDNAMNNTIRRWMYENQNIKLKRKGQVIGFKDYLTEKGIEIYPVSVLLNEGLKEVLYKTYDMLSHIEREPLEEETDITKLLKELKIEKEDFEITRDEEDAIVVGGRIVDDVLAKYVIGMDDESLVTFLHMMRNLGMEEALQEFGVQDGDTVKIADVEFEYFE